MGRGTGETQTAGTAFLLRSERYEAQGITDPAIQRLWIEHQIDPELAGQYVESGLQPAAASYAAEYRDNGFDPCTAKPWIRNRFKPREAAAAIGAAKEALADVPEEACQFDLSRELAGPPGRFLIAYKIAFSQVKEGQM